MCMGTFTFVRLDSVLDGRRVRSPRFLVSVDRGRKNGNFSGGRNIRRQYDKEVISLNIFFYKTGTNCSRKMIGSSVNKRVRASIVSIDTISFSEVFR